MVLKRLPLTFFTFIFICLTNVRIEGQFVNVPIPNDQLIKQHVQVNPNYYNVGYNQPSINRGNDDQIVFKEDKYPATAFEQGGPSAGGQFVIQPQQPQSSSYPVNTFGPEQNPIKTTNDLPVSDAINDFSINMLQKLVERDSDKNLVVSPISVSVLISLLQQGADDDTLTARELNDVLGQSKQTSRETYRSIMYGIKDNKRSNTILFSNGMYVNKKNKFSPSADIKSFARQYYLTQLEDEDFSQQQALAHKINEWASKNTKGAIPYLISPDSIRPDSDCILVNSFYFKGTWKRKFDAKRTRPNKFNRNPYTSDDIDFMWTNGKYNVNQDDRIGAKWLSLPFDGERYEMVFVLPIESHDLNNLIRKLDRNDLKKIITETYEHKAALGIPKFNLSQDSSMREILYEMGLREVFTSNSRITSFSKSRRPMIISAVTQKATISVDENGSISAAGTAVVVNTLSLPSPDETFIFRANEPFLAILVDKQNSIPLLISKVNNPY